MYFETQKAQRKIKVSVTSCEFGVVCDKRANDARHVCMGMLPAEREDLRRNLSLTEKTQLKHLPAVAY